MQKQSPFTLPKVLMSQAHPSTIPAIDINKTYLHINHTHEQETNNYIHKQNHLYINDIHEQDIFTTNIVSDQDLKNLRY